VSPDRGSTLPSERDWERADVVHTQAGPLIPEMIGDGGGIPFPPSALAAPAGRFEDPEDPAVRALLVYIGAAKHVPPLPWRKGPPPPLPPAAVQALADWRELARVDGKALFGRGVPPELMTVAVERSKRGSRWSGVAQSAARPLRATRDGIRASSWRLDPSSEVHATDTALRILLTEQTFAGGKRASGRILAPDLHEGESELTLTFYVTPQVGFQQRSPNPETPVHVELPCPVGDRELSDGSLYEALLSP
jgi:hypothetical protein